MIVGFHHTPHMPHNFSCLSQYFTSCPHRPSAFLLDPPFSAPPSTIKEQLSSGTRHPASRILPTHIVYYLNSWRICSAHRSRFWISPSAFFLTIHMPYPDKANFKLIHRLSCCALPLDTLLSGALFCGSLLFCSSLLPWRGSWKHFLALRGPSPISFWQVPLAGLEGSGTISSWDV